MAIISHKSSILSAFLAAAMAPEVVDAHGYLKTPRSRNYHASVDPKWWGGTDSDPEPENCPHCLNIGGTAAVCGLVGDHNYDYPPNAVGGILAPILQACYEPGSIIELETILTAHHKGHFTYKACGIKYGEVPTSECFDANPLTFVSDDLYGANPDPNYPERAYIPLKEFPGGLQYEAGGNALFRHKFRLPEGLSGDLVLIQWHYVTANSCMDEGYDSYDWPEGFHPGNVAACGVLPPDGRGVPEQFWNCAEVKVSTNCGNGPPTDPETTSTTTTGTTINTGATATTTTTTTATETEPTSTTTTGTTINTGATVTTTTTSTEGTTTTSMPPSGDLVLDSQPRCGFSELDAREQCKPLCASDNDCGEDEFCWQPHANYCGSIPQRIYEEPKQSPVVTRCGVSEEVARTFCGEPCSWQCSKPGDSCIAVHSNYCDSPYNEVGSTSTSTIPATTTIAAAPTSTTDAATSTTASASSSTSTNVPTTTSTFLSSTLSPITTPSPSSAAQAVENVLDQAKHGIDNKILRYQTPSMLWEPSTVYRYDDLLAALRVMYNDGVANKFFFMGDNSPEGHKYGLANIAAFLAQSMKETIKVS